ncbi:MAG: ABC transporter ATP-binding protein [Desulfobulbaceae bacterium]|nr:ABC transporter ATP-binding protein [Desulfobulbaceae bacterium]
MSHHIVEADGLSYTYPDSTRGIRDIRFRITHGESVAIVGANGAGKSTLLLHLNGSLTPGTGTVRIGDYPLTRQNLQNVRRTVGMVFQDPDDQLFMPTVFDDVAFGPLNLGLLPEEVEQRVQDALDRVNAGHLRARTPYKLSGGEKRAVAIATVLAMSPDILIMDEPSSNLDPLARQHLIEILQSFEHTKIIATHDLDLAMNVCKRIIVLHEGSITADGPTVTIFHDKELLAASGLAQPLAMQNCPACGSPPVFLEKKK